MQELLFKVGDIIKLNVDTVFHRVGLLAEVLSVDEPSGINSDIKVKVIDDKYFGNLNGRVLGADSKLFILHERKGGGVHV